MTVLNIMVEGLLFLAMIGCHKIGNRDSALDQQWQSEFTVLCVTVIKRDGQSRLVVESAIDSALAFLQINDLKICSIQSICLSNSRQLIVQGLGDAVGDPMIKQDEHWNLAAALQVPHLPAPIDARRESIGLDQFGFPAGHDVVFGWVLDALNVQLPSTSEGMKVLFLCNQSTQVLVTLE